MARPTRTERDLLGSRDLPAKAYYGVHTLRALENFPISGTPISIYPDLIVALACVKRAAAMANHDLDLLNAERTGGPSRRPVTKSAPVHSTTSSLLT